MRGFWNKATLYFVTITLVFSIMLAPCLSYSMQGGGAPAQNPPSRALWATIGLIGGTFATLVTMYANNRLKLNIPSPSPTAINITIDVPAWIEAWYSWSWINKSISVLMATGLGLLAKYRYNSFIACEKTAGRHPENFWLPTRIVCWLLGKKLK
jgi:hypothetical protein